MKLINRKLYRCESCHIFHLPSNLEAGSWSRLNGELIFPQNVNIEEAKLTAYTLYLIMFGFYFVESAETIYMKYYHLFTIIIFKEMVLLSRSPS